MKKLFVTLIDDFRFPYNQIKAEFRLKLEDIANFQEDDLTIGKIIGELFNFQNIDGIQKAFGNLFGIEKGMLNQLRVHYEANDGSIRPWDELKTLLLTAFKKRHQAIHRPRLEFEMIQFIEELSAKLDFTRLFRSWLFQVPVVVPML